MPFFVPNCLRASTSTVVDAGVNQRLAKSAAMVSGGTPSELRSSRSEARKSAAEDETIFFVRLPLIFNPVTVPEMAAGATSMVRAFTPMPPK